MDTGVQKGGGKSIGNAAVNLENGMFSGYLYYSENRRDRYLCPWQLHYTRE